MSCTPVDRFWNKVTVDPIGCWLWHRPSVRDGYARFRITEGSSLAHRIAYEPLVGPIPNDMDLDHLCRVRHCVNPLHLEPVPHRENCRRGSAGAHMAANTHCPQGHPYDGANLYINPRGGRMCRTCGRERMRAK